MRSIFNHMKGGNGAAHKGTEQNDSLSEEIL